MAGSPTHIEPCINLLIECAKMAKQDGLDHFVFVAMGASNLAASAILNLAQGNGGKRTYLLDTTDPAALLKLEAEFPFERALFVFSK